MTSVLWAYRFHEKFRLADTETTTVRTRNGSIVRVWFVGSPEQVMEQAGELARQNRGIPDVYRDVTVVSAEKEQQQPGNNKKRGTEENTSNSDEEQHKTKSSSSSVPAKRIDQTTLLYDKSGYPYVHCEPEFARTVLLYHFRQQTDPWFAIRQGRVTATAAATIAGLNRHQYVWDYLPEWLGERKRVEDPGSVDVLRYGNEFEDTNRACFTRVTGLQVAETGFVIDTDHDNMGISPDGFVQPAKLSTADCYAPSRTHINTLPREFETGLALFEAKCSPFHLPDYFKVSYVGQTHAQMGITGLHRCWASMWHQYKLRIVLVEFVQELWDWMMFRIRVFLVICQLFKPDEARKQIRECGLWVPEVAQATEADWFPTKRGDQAFAARYSNSHVHTNGNYHEFVRILNKLIPNWVATTPRWALKMIPSRPRIHPVYEWLETPFESDLRAEKGYVLPVAWPPKKIPDTVVLPTLNECSDGHYHSPHRRTGVVRHCAPCGAIPAAIAEYQPLYTNKND